MPEGPDGAAGTAVGEPLGPDCTDGVGLWLDVPPASASRTAAVTSSSRAMTGCLPRRWGRGTRVRPAPPVGLLEPEVGVLLATVVEGHGQPAAGAGPGLGRLPDVGVLASDRIVGQCGIPGAGSLLDVVDRRARVAGYLLRRRRSGGEDVQALVTTQAELDRDGAAGLRHVD